MRQKMIAFLLLGLCLFLVAMAVVVGLWCFGDIRPEEPPRPEEDLVYEIDDRGERVEEPEVPAERVIPERDSAVIPEQVISADGEYFADAAFLVNSVSMGLSMYDYDGLLTRADFYGVEKLSAFEALDFIRDMEDGDYGKVYISLGINELWRDMDALRACYMEMLEELMGYSSDSIIVLVSVPPVSAYRSSTNANYTGELVAEYNEMLRTLAEDWGVWYLDVHSVLADEEGYLPSAVTEDGIHFTPAHYQRWFEHLATHYINDGTVETELLPAEAEAMEAGQLPASEP